MPCSSRCLMCCFRLQLIILMRRREKKNLGDFCANRSVHDAAVMGKIVCVEVVEVSVSTVLCRNSRPNFSKIGIGN
jgi:hypothetical protein